MTEQSIGGLLDSLGITVDLEAGEHLVEAIVIAKLAPFGGDDNTPRLIHLHQRRSRLDRAGRPAPRRPRRYRDQPAERTNRGRRVSTVHVVPIGDLVEHLVPGGLDGHGPGCRDCAGGTWLTLEEDPDAPDTACPCFPTPEQVPNPAGRDGWLLVHHSLDGREQHEQASADTAQETE